MFYQLTYDLSETARRGVFALLAAADHEFVPPLSARRGTTQKDLLTAAAPADGIAAYFAQLAGQACVLAMEESRVCGFLSFIPDHMLDALTPPLRCDYVSTIVVDPACRGRGITAEMYRTLFSARPGHSAATRTWSQNHAHLAVLRRLGFTPALTLADDRGPGIDTVYYIKTADD